MKITLKQLRQLIFEQLMREGKKASKSVGKPYGKRKRGKTESQAQQMAAGIALRAREEGSKDSAIRKLKGAPKEMAKMSLKDLRKLATIRRGSEVPDSTKTGHERAALPGHVSESTLLPANDKVKNFSMNTRGLKESMSGAAPMENNVKFSGILKLMPSGDIVNQASQIVGTLPMETALPTGETMNVVPLPPEKFHVTLAHQSVLKPFRKEIKKLAKSGQLPPFQGNIILNPQWEQRDDPVLGRRSWVAWVVNEDEVKNYLNQVMAMVGGPMNLWDVETPPRRFHVSLANLTGNPGDSVR